MSHQNVVGVTSGATGMVHQQHQARRYTDSALSPPILHSNPERQSQMTPITASTLTQESDFGQFPSVPDLPSGFSANFPFSPATTHSTFEQPVYPFSAGPTDSSVASVGVKPEIDLSAFGAELHQRVMTPEGASQSGSTHTSEDKDPFLTILEQLAENEHSMGGPSDLDFYLGDQPSLVT